MKRIAFVVNVDWFFISHRLPIALAALGHGYDVTVIANDTGKRKQIEAYGLKFIELPISRGESKIIDEIKIVNYLRKLYSAQKFDLVYQVGLKLILFGTLSLFFVSKKIKQINALSGAGSLFSYKGKQSLAVNFLIKFFKATLNNSAIFIFQNNEDRELFYSISTKINETNSFIIKGSGVDLKLFDFTQLPLHSPKLIVYTGRLIREKGIVELVSAANQLRVMLEGKAKFIIVGDIDIHNPGSISKEFIIDNSIANYIEFLGYRTDIIDILKSSYCYVFPSYYREGIPKSAIEAAAIGRPIITTDSVGCREVVENNRTGILLQPKNIIDLGHAILDIIENEDKAIEWGKEARIKAVKEFDLDIITKQTMQIIINHLIK